MKQFTKSTVAMAIAAGTVAGLVGATVPASAQQKTFIQKRYNTPLTVRRRPVVAPVAAAVAAPVGVASTLVGAPFAALNTIFPTPGPRVGGPTAVRYANSGPETNKIDEGFAQPVPVDRSGPIFVVQNGDPTVSPLTFIGAPIAAAGTLTTVPFKILNGVTGAAL